MPLLKHLTMFSPKFTFPIMALGGHMMPYCLWFNYKMCLIRSIEALLNQSIYCVQIFEQWCQVVFSMKSIKEGLTILMVKDNTFKPWSNVLLKWKAFGWYEKVVKKEMHSCWQVCTSMPNWAKCNLANLIYKKPYQSESLFLQQKQKWKFMPLINERMVHGH